MKKTSIRMLCEAALLIAAAQILSYLKLWKMPWGGSVTLAMLPIILFAVRWGVRKGLLAGFALGILQFALDGGLAIGWQSIIGDYLLAYTALGFAGFLTGKKNAVFTGTLLGGAARFLVHYVVGATVWAEYMPETFLGLAMRSAWFYSALYNLLYMLPNIAMTILLAFMLYKPLKKYFNAEDLQ